MPAITVAELTNRRNEFWDTRVQGRAECWQAIRVAVEADDEATTEAILESAELTLFDIEKPDTCFTYDSKGFKYEIPLYCLYTPGNLVKETNNHINNNNNTASSRSFSSNSSTSSAVATTTTLQVQPAPSKLNSSSSTASPGVDEMKSQSISSAATNVIDDSSIDGKPIKFKIRFSNGLSDYTLEVKSGYSMGQIKALIINKYSTQTQLQTDKLRLYYLGRNRSSHRQQENDRRFTANSLSMLFFSVSLCWLQANI